LALGGVLVSSLLYCGLPFLDFHLAAALVGLFITFVGVEIAIVSSLSLFTEILPKARVVMMSSNVGAQALGRLLGGVVGGVGYSLTESFSAVGVLAMGIGLIAAALLYFKIHEQETPVTA